MMQQRTRITWTPGQLARMQDLFSPHELPSFEERSKLIAELAKLGTTPTDKQLTSWFTQHRKKVRKERVENLCSPMKSPRAPAPAPAAADAAAALAYTVAATMTRDDFTAHVAAALSDGFDGTCAVTLYDLPGALVVGLYKLIWF
jgi:hypothetical protein